MAKYNHEFKRINELKKMEEDIYYIIPDFLYRSINVNPLQGDEKQVISTFKKLYTTVENEISFKNLTLLTNSIKLTLILNGDLELMKRILTDTNFGRIIILELSKKPADNIEETKKQDEIIQFFLNEYYGNYKYYQKTAEVRDFINLIHDLFSQGDRLENIITFPYSADRISKKLYFIAIEDYLINSIIKAKKDIKIHSYVEFYNLKRMITLINNYSCKIEENTIEGFKDIGEEESLVPLLINNQK